MISLMPVAASITLRPRGSAIFSLMAFSARDLVQLHPAAQEVVGVDIAQHHVGVGDRGVLPALAVAGGAGDGAGALRARPSACW